MTVKTGTHILNLCAGLSVSLLMGCNFLNGKSTFTDVLGTSANSPSGSSPAGTTGGSSGGGQSFGYVGTGTGLSGQGDITVPTGKAAFLRIANGLEGNVTPYGGYMFNGYGKLISNFTNTTDPTNFTGAGATMLLAYASCVNITGGPMQTLYHINIGASASANQAALLAAGLRILDHQTGGLASGSSVTPQVTAALNAIVANSIADGSTAEMAFVTICTATSSAASTMLGF